MCHVNCNENKMNMYMFLMYGFEEIWYDLFRFRPYQFVCL